MRLVAEDDYFLAQKEHNCTEECEANGYNCALGQVTQSHETCRVPINHPIPQL